MEGGAKMRDVSLISIRRDPIVVGEEVNGALVCEVLPGQFHRVNVTSGVDELNILAERVSVSGEVDKVIFKALTMEAVAGLIFENLEQVNGGRKDGDR